MYIAFRAAAWIAERLPPRVAEAGARLGGRIGYRLARGKRRIVRSNLRRVAGDEGLDDLVRRAFISYAEYWLETFRLGRYSPEDLRSMVSMDDESREAIDSAFAEGMGVILVTAHIGFYDLGVAWVGVSGWPFTTVAEVLRPRALFEWFAAVRERRGMKVIPAKPGARARQRLVDTVKAKEGVAILAERDLGRRGIWVDFFGERTTFPAGPALLISSTKAPLLAGAVFKEGSGYRTIFRRIDYLRETSGDEWAAVTQIIAKELEELIRLHPEQWHLFSTNWPSDESHLPERGRPHTGGGPDLGAPEVKGAP